MLRGVAPGVRSDGQVRLVSERECIEDEGDEVNLAFSDWDRSGIYGEERIKVVMLSGDSPFVPGCSCGCYWWTASVLLERLPLVQDECQVMAAPLSEVCGLQVCRYIPA